MEISPWEPDKAARKVLNLIFSFIDPLASSDSGKSSSELAMLSVEAVLALHGLIMQNPCTNDISISQASRSEQLLDGYLIDAIVGMMLDGFKGLTSPELAREQLLRARRGVERRAQNPEQRERARARAERLAGAAEQREEMESLFLALDRGLRLLVESCLIRILLRVWKATPATQLSKDQLAWYRIFFSSRRLWAPLEATVDLTKNSIKFGNRGDRLTDFNDDNQDKLLKSDDLEMIIEFVEYLQKDRKKSAFIARNADVGINRLYVHLDRRADWDYELYDLREPRTLCSRSINTENGMA
ncbi:hypothetical protein FRC05_008355 [Tulasnella sp. 425]|nr:hypothetical protein FRC05_008355 [Tulasnella sp. 425]